MPQFADADLEALNAELGWVRRLALSLVRNGSDADDIAQETWLAAKDHAPSDRPLRPWLSRVVLNVVRMRARSDARRMRRESAVDVDQHGLSPAELVDRVELQRALVDAVLALDEPYRATVLLHFVEGLPCVEIARRLQIPDGTVRRRLKVALDELRDRLAPDRSRSRLWAVLTPLVGTPYAAGRIAMKKLLVVIVIIAVVAVGIVFVSKRGKPKGSGAASVGKTSTGAVVKGEHVGGEAGVRPWFAQVGASARRVAGKVVFEGAPVEGAIVRLADHEQLAAVTTGKDGAFDFGMQAPAEVTVSAEASGKTPAALALALADPNAKTEGLVLELTGCRAQLHGSVVDASGGGIAKAHLRVAGFGGAESNATGEYALCVPMGDSTVRIEADGYGALALPIHLVGAHRRDFELVPEAEVTGKVVDEQGSPVAQAHILAVPQAIETPHFLANGYATSDDDGTFKISNLAPGRFNLLAEAEGFGSTNPTAAVALAGTSNKPVTIVVAMRTSVSGRVVTGDKPVAGARITLAGGGLRFVRPSYSQKDGSFVLEGVPAGRVRLDAGTYEVITPKALVVPKTGMKDLKVEVSELATLRGHVTRKGEPVSAAVIQTTQGPTTQSDQSGYYEIRGLQKGTVQVTAQAFGTTNAFSPFTPVKLASGGPTDYDIDLKGAAEVHGIVVDESGAPVPNVYVRLLEPRGDLGESMTDAQGKFTCTSMLGNSDYRAAVFPSPGARVAFPAATEYPVFKIADGNTIVEGAKIAIKNERLTIAGRVIDAEGNAVSDVHVEAIGRGFAAGPAMLPSVRADQGGSFVIKDLARGTYVVHAHAGDGSDVQIPNVAAGTTDITVRLESPATIEGDLIGFTTPPRVHARQNTSELTLNNEATMEGNHYSITGLAPGRYIVEALGDNENDGETVELKSGATLKVNLESHGRGTIEGVVTEFGAGGPVANMNCYAAQSMQGLSGDIGANAPTNDDTTTNAKGEFKVAAPVGMARLMCFSADGSFSVAGIDIKVAAAGVTKATLAAVRAVPPPSDVGFRIRPMMLPLTIAAVEPTSPAATAGLKVGDVLLTIDGTSVAGLIPSGAMTLAWNHRPGTTIALGVERAGKPVSVQFPVRAPTN
ncbi:MAG TPA: sigma-70 family RNA polymerase sigma factor [Kofleriaceae bacterium]|nr:sigma-70 family RNA polymerase sigma factor [Kofleriaceae bacterium]